MSRIRAIAKRWLSMISCGTLAAVIWVFIQEPVRNLLMPATAYLASLNPAFLSSGILLVTIAICWPFGNRRWRGFLGIHHLHTYPPLWVAGTIAMLIILASARFTPAEISAPEIFNTLLWSTTAVPLWLWPVIAAAGFVGGGVAPTSVTP